MTPKELLEHIISVYQSILDQGTELKAQKKEFETKVAATSEGRKYEQAKQAAKEAKLDLDDAIEKSQELSDMKFDLQSSNEALASSRATLSKLLVTYAAKTKHRSFPVGDTKLNREIVMVARVGGETMQQIDLFDGAGETE